MMDKSRLKSLFYNIFLFLFTLGVAFLLHWAAGLFFRPISLTPVFAVELAVSGGIMIIAIPMVLLLNDILRKDRVGNYESASEAVQSNNIYQRSGVMITKAAIFLVSYLLVTPIIEVSPLSAELMRQSFNQIISAVAFGFVIYTMLAET